MPSSSRQAAEQSQVGETSSMSQATASMSERDRRRHEKRSVRQDYRSLIQTTENMRSSLNDHNAIDLSTVIRRGTNLNEKVNAPTEGVLDSKFLLNASEIGAQMARNLKIEAGFETDDYLKRCLSLIGGEVRTMGRNTRTRDDDDDDDDEDEDGQRAVDRWDWEKLGRLAAKRTKRAPTLDFLLGPLAVEEKVRNVARRAPMERSGPVVKPQQLNEQDIVKSENETTKLVREISKRLDEVGKDTGVNFFSFVIDPHSFANTVENIFYLSFLVRDGRVSLEENEKKEPILMNCEQPSADDYAQGLTKQQLIMEFDMATWKDLIEVYDIRTACIRSREEQTNTDTWTR